MLKSSVRRLTMHRPRIATIAVGLLIIGIAFCQMAYAHQEGALSEAAWKGDLKQVQELLDRGANVNVKNAHGETALMRSAGMGHWAVVKLLLDRGADVNVKDRRGDTALLLASSGRRPEIVKLLLDKGAQANVKDKFGSTPLMMAQDLETFKMLLKRGSDINAKTTDSPPSDHAPQDGEGQAGLTALMLAAAYGSANKVRLLLDAGAEINARDDAGMTALMKASRDGHFDVVKVLLERKADINAKNSHGVTALYWASKKGHTQIIKLLKTHGAKE